MRNIILGTAGHIDHGKSSLVKALTGIDPDRLKEEKERGITIDIGFADLRYPEDDLTVGIVDVPGHEKLISNMLAGAGGIDMVLLVIAADEGIMPQSREHLAICNLLKIKSGLVAVTKSDLVEKDWLGLVMDDIKNFVHGTFLSNAPVIPVSSKTGKNLDQLKKEISTIAQRIASKPSGGLFRLPIDRVFSLKGFGTVVTGTAVSGTISVDEPVEILPCDLKTKVRGLHSHGRTISTAYAGQRVALNLQGVEKESLRRGDVVVTPASFRPTKTIDAFLELLKESPVLKSKSLVHFYTGTSETVARIILYDREDLKAGEHCYCQLRLQDPVVAMSGDRYILRRFSPLETLGGGEILDPSPARRRRKDSLTDLDILLNGSLEEKTSLKIEKAGVHGISANALHGWIQAELPAIASALEKLLKSGKILRHEQILLHRNSLEVIQKKLSGLLETFHRKNPLKPGMSKEEARNLINLDSGLFNFIISGLKNIIADKNILRLKSFSVTLSGNEEANRTKIFTLLDKKRFQPPSKSEMAAELNIDPKQLSDILGILSKEGRVVRINESLYLSASSFQDMLSLLKDFFSGKQEITVAEFRDMIGTSRKFALPFLEYLDANNITLRTGDVRKLIQKK